jgi:Neutral/alkaline non-lysosomal ceramidase, N-terminal
MIESPSACLRALTAGAVLLAACSLTSCSLLFPPRGILPDTSPPFVLAESSGPVEAGAALVDITPEKTVCLAGFSFWRRSSGVHDPIYARALAVRRGAVKAVIVAVDLIGLHHHQVEEVRRRLKGRVAPESVLIAATHNHSGPDTLGLWGIPPFMSGISSWYVEEATAGIVLAAERALDALGPARVRWGEAQADAEGVSRNIREPALIDRKVTAFAFDRPDGSPIATLVHFTCHPEILGRKNHLISADYPSALCSELEAARPGSTAIFLNGALGGMVTAWEKKETFEEVDRIGRAVAKTALAALAGGETLPEVLDMACVNQSMLVPIQNRRYHLGNLFGLFAHRPYVENGHTKSEVMALRLGPALLLTAPGEVLPRVGFEIADLARGARPFCLVGLGNDELGYLIHEEDFARDLYSYERTVSPGPLTVTLLRSTAKGVLLLVTPPKAPPVAIGTALPVKSPVETPAETPAETTPKK